MTDVLVLCYHAFSPSWRATTSVTPENFERHVQILARQGWQATTFTEAVLSPPAPRTLAVTFDDAFATVREYAEPILSAVGWPATVFAPTAFMSARQRLHWEGFELWEQSPDAPELTGMDWDDLGELSEQGWEIGSHTHSHRRLSKLPDDELHEELSRSRSECTARLGIACGAIAYPYGDVNDRVMDAARAAGYHAGAGLPRDLRQLGLMCWPRVGIYQGDDSRRFRLKIAPIMRHLRPTRLWPIH